MRSGRCCTSVESSLRERRCTAPLKKSVWQSGGRSSPSAIISWDGNSLCSDHAPLQWLHRMKDTNPSPGITRWYLALQPFKLKVIHRPGTQMTVTDFLSRNGGGGVRGLQAGGLPGLSRAVGVCGEGGVVQRSLQRERDSADNGE